jgi:hypothetical protein
MIVEHVQRDRATRDLHHVLRYGDLQGLLPDPGGRDRLYLAVHFRGAVGVDVPEHRQSRRSGRQRADAPAGATYFRICDVHFHPECERVREAEGTPWAEEPGARVVFADVHPIERKVSAWFPGLRAGVAAALGAEIDRRCAAGWDARWLLHVALLPESSELELGRTTWTALLRQPEDVWRVPLI